MKGEVLQELAIFRYLVLCNSIGHILKSGDFLSVQEQDVSEIEDTGEIKELRRAIEGMRQNRKSGEIVGRKEFREYWERGLVDCNGTEKILEEQVGDSQEMDSRELEEHQVNITISASQIGNPQCEFPQ